MIRYGMLVAVQWSHGRGGVEWSGWSGWNGVG